MAVNLTNLTANVNNIQSLSDKPNETDGLTAQGLKEKFDKAGADIKSFINGTHIPELERKMTGYETKHSETDSAINTINSNLAALESRITERLNDLTPKVLWENLNPEIAFSETTITLSSNDYDYYEVFYYSIIGEDLYKAVQSKKGIKGKKLLIDTAFSINSNVYTGRRYITDNNDGTLLVNNCFSMIETNNYFMQQHNNWCVPIKIVGYKF